MKKIWLCMGMIVTATMLLTGCGDKSAPVKPMEEERAEAIDKVKSERQIMARYQVLARGQYNVNEYIQLQYESEWRSSAGLKKDERDVARKKIQADANAEIKKRQAEFKKLREDHQNSRTLVTSVRLKNAAYDNLNLGLRIASAAVQRQDQALKNREIKFNLAKDKMDQEKRNTEEEAIKKAREACNKRKSDISFVYEKRDAVITLAMK